MAPRGGGRHGDGYISGPLLVWHGAAGEAGALSEIPLGGLGGSGAELRVCVFRGR